MFKKLFLIFLAFFLGLVWPTSAQTLAKVEGWEAEEALIRLSPIRFLPDHPFYFVITLKEKFDYFRQMDKSKKALFDVFLSGKKIKEAYLLVQKNDSARSLKSLQNYQKIQERLQKELREAGNQGLPVFEVKRTLAENLERHLKIIAILIEKSGNENLRQELGKSITSIKTTTSALEKDLPDASEKIINFADLVEVGQ